MHVNANKVETANILSIDKKPIYRRITKDSEMSQFSQMIREQHVQSLQKSEMRNDNKLDGDANIHNHGKHTKHSKSFDALWAMARNRMNKDG